MLLACLLVVCPLGFAYGQDAPADLPAVEQEQAAPTPEDDVVAESEDNLDGLMDAPVAEGDSATELAAVETEEAPVDAPDDGAAPGDAAQAVVALGDAQDATSGAPADDVQADSPEQHSLFALATSQAKGAAAYEPLLAPVEGVVSLLVVVVGFLGADGDGVMPYDDSYDWAQSFFGSSNSLSDYYEQMSQGAFTFAPAAESSAYGEGGNTNKADKVNDGIVHVSLPEAHGNWADKYTGNSAVANSMLNMLEHALNQASTAVDFTSFDADDDGTLATNELAIAFIVAGYESSLLSVSQSAPWYSLWGHQWSYSEAGKALPQVDGVTVDSYVAIGEKATDIVGNKVVASQAPYSIIAHEMGHVLGLPDLYDTAVKEGDDWWAYSVDDASLMATGSYAAVNKQGTTTYVPTALDAWSRYQLGWTTPTVVTKSGVYTVSAQNSKKGYSTLLIPTKRKGEYYIIENRTFAGYDAGLGTAYDNYRNGGIVIWHIDNGVISRYLATNQVNASTHRPGVMPLYAEEDENKNGDWTYRLDFKTSIPDDSLLFWTKGMWERHFGSAAALNLPLYGSGKKGDDPVRRLLSNIRIQFLSKAGPDMQIRIVMPGDPLPEVATSAKKPATSVCDYAEPYVEAIPATGDELPAGALATAMASFALFLFARKQTLSFGKHARSGRL